MVLVSAPAKVVESLFLVIRDISTVVRPSLFFEPGEFSLSGKKFRRGSLVRPVQVLGFRVKGLGLPVPGSSPTN